MDNYRINLLNVKNKIILENYNNMLENTQNSETKLIINNLLKSLLQTKSLTNNNHKLNDYDVTKITKTYILLNRSKDDTEYNFHLDVFRDTTKNVDKNKYIDYITNNIEDEKIKLSMIDIIKNQMTVSQNDYMNTKDAQSEIQKLIYKREWHKLPENHKINRLNEYIDRLNSKNKTDTYNILLELLKEKKLNNKVVNYDVRNGQINEIKGLIYNNDTKMIVVDIKINQK